MSEDRSPRFSPYGADLFGDSAERKPVSPVAARFTVPPFSVLSARDGAWQDRKRAWVSLGIESEIGRGSNLTWNLSTARYDHYRVKEGTRSYSGEQSTSIFDPVLCEIICSWFSAPNDLVLDPFAGGSVRGIVAACLGRKYHGIELRVEQVTANRSQADRIVPDAPPPCGL